MRYIQSTCIFLGLALGFTGALAASPAEIELRYQRQSTADRPAVPSPAAAPLPEVLKLETVKVAPAVSAETADLETRAG